MFCCTYCICGYLHCCMCCVMSVYVLSSPWYVYVLVFVVCPCIVMYVCMVGLWLCCGCICACAFCAWLWLRCPVVHRPSPGRRAKFKLLPLPLSRSAPPEWSVMNDPAFSRRPRCAKVDRAQHCSCDAGFHMSGTSDNSICQGETVRQWSSLVSLVMLAWLVWFNLV